MLLTRVPRRAIFTLLAVATSIAAPSMLPGFAIGEEAAPLHGSVADRATCRSSVPSCGNRESRFVALVRRGLPSSGRVRGVAPQPTRGLYFAVRCPRQFEVRCRFGLRARAASDGAVIGRLRASRPAPASNGCQRFPLHRRKLGESEPRDSSFCRPRSAWVIVGRCRCFRRLRWCGTFQTDRKSVV